MPLLSDSEEFVLRSGVRSGLKREFAFALKAQAELPVSLGRTRSGKSPPALRPVPANNNKKVRRSDRRDAPKPGDAASEGVSMEQDGSMAGASPSLLVEKPVTTYRRSRFACEASLPSPLQISRRDVSNADPLVAINGHDGSAAVSCGVLEKDSASEIPILSDLQDGSKADVGLPEEVMDGRDGLSAVSASPDKNSASETSMVIDGEDGSRVDVEPAEKLIECRDSLSEECAILEKNSSSETSMVIDCEDDSKVDFQPPEKIPEDPAVPTQDDANDRYGPKVESDVLEIPARRFTRSMSKVPSIKLEEPKAEVEDPLTDQTGPEAEESKLEYPTKRITRSATKVENIVAADNESVGSEGRKAGMDGVHGSMSATPKKKLELKMSKKIALTKFPSNVRELLATGLLEGLAVKYITCKGLGKRAGLDGVIKDGRILCSCDTCKGYKAISAFQFELHAGSNKKHPSHFIYLENGKSLHDILKECTTAPLDMLEAAIQNAVGPAPPRKPFICQQCHETFDTTRIGKFAMLCDSCLKLKQLETTPCLTNGTDGSVRSPSSVPVTNSSDSASISKLSHKKNSYGRITRKDLGLHKLVFMGGILLEGTEVGYYVRGKKLLEGYIKDSGIFCHCCKSVVSPSLFEAHAGRAQRRKPYNNIYTSNGVSLHELSVSLSKDRKLSSSENDDLCSICADGGDLICCDLCPRAFHKECVGLSTIPEGDYYCQYCRSLHQRERALSHNDNAIAAGRVAGVDPIQQIFQRCIRMVQTPESDDGVCVLCRCHDFSTSRFSARTVMICDQCEKEYHVGCLKEHNMADLKELPEGDWFCCTDCSRIYTSLNELVLCGAERVEDSCYDVIKKKHEERVLDMGLSVHVRWRLLSGKSSSADTKLLLSRAVSIFHECFDPIVDVVTGRDLIPAMVYGRTVRDQEYRGIYCAILTVDSMVVSAGILRVLGSEVAELPLVATHRESQGLGYFQALFLCIERLLRSLKVKHFLLPAADEAESIWTKKFGFSKITNEQVQEYAKGVRPLVFQGTSMLHKLVADSSP